MHIKENLISFLYDKKYFINIYDENIYVFNYLELLVLEKNKIKLKLENFNLSIIGDNLNISRMIKNEILIKGKIKNIGIDYV